MNRHDNGFTVVEALVAFAILSLMLVSVYAMSGTTLQSVERAETFDRAVLLAQSKLAELATVRTALPEKSQGGFPGTDVTWRIETKDVYPNTQGDLRLQEVHLELMWSDGDAPRNIAIDTRHLGAVTQ